MFFPENRQANDGHWTAILKHPNNKFEYFDSYEGYKPDEEQKWLSAKLKKQLHIDRPLLTNLFLRSGIETVICNPYTFQVMKFLKIKKCGNVLP